MVRHRVDQPGEAVLKLFAIEGGEVTRALGADGNHAGLAQHLEVVRERGLGQVEPDEVGDNLIFHLSKLATRNVTLAYFVIS